MEGAYWIYLFFYPVLVISPNLNPFKSCLFKSNVAKTISCLPSPSHHHQYIGGINFTSPKFAVYGIVLPTSTTESHALPRNPLGFRVRSKPHSKASASFVAMTTAP